KWEQLEDLARIDSKFPPAINKLSNAPDEAITNARQQDLVLATARDELQALRAERAFAEARIRADDAQFAKAPDAADLANSAAHLERALAAAVAQRDVAKANLALFVARMNSQADAKSKALIAAAEKVLAKTQQQLSDAR